MSDYYHITLTATLENTTALTIGNGEFGARNTSESAENSNKSQNYIQICTDASDQLYIPGSTLKGNALAFSRRLQDEHHQTPDLSWLFGKEVAETLEKNANNHRGQETRKASTGGQVRFLNATAPSRTISSVTRNSIDPITGAAQDKHLFNQEYAPPGTQFTLQLQIDSATDVQLRQLAGFLTRWGDEQARLGRNTNNNAGLFKIDNFRFTGLTKAAYLDWIRTPGTHAPEPTSFDTPAATFSVADDYLTLDLNLMPLSPIFVGCDHIEYHDAQGKKIADKCEGKPKQQGTHEVIVAVKNKQGHPVIPATSMRGVLRHQAQRILNTFSDLHGEQAAKDATARLRQLLGGTEQAANFQLTDFIAAQNKAMDQPFIAIDRFTGGVKGGTQSDTVAGGNYWVEKHAVTHYAGQIRLHPRLLDQAHHAELAVLLLLLRDLLDGELRFGAYQAKGFGKTAATIQFQPFSQPGLTSAASNTLTDWEAFRKFWRSQPFPDFNQLTTALHHKLDENTHSTTSGTEAN
ncbi:RAMP superfamily CRISPR-associated protein [Vibrio spartinae]|uniref:CRISPR-associated RAMP protein, family n=1 Tax=Vibrio spartinae TaxID=1918945 RepID=A0ABX6R4W2_9VIBR|nr:RAMP superfamily CRISPR-associated protein [Vibrio spartinae]QMV16212.1 CRISPR-associated RAMP protein, family [Vibrio spartinae]